jgi:hypothetical protein
MGARAFTTMSGDADPLPYEMWASATGPMLDFVSGRASSVPAPRDVEVEVDPTERYDESVMTERRQVAIRRAASSRGDSALRLLEIVGVAEHPLAGGPQGNGAENGHHHGAKQDV